MFNRVTALNWCQKLVFAKYLENGWTEFDQILYILYHWQDLCLYRKGSFFANLQQLQPLIYVRNCFFLNILGVDGQNLTKFCIHITIDKVWVGIVIYFFFIFAQSLFNSPWLILKMMFAQYLENGWTEFKQIFIDIFFDKIYVGKIKHHFSQICNGVKALDCCQKSAFAQYLDNECGKFNQTLYIYYHWYDLSTISSSNRVVLLNISLSSDSAMAGL